MENPKISVIIPIFNVEEYLEETLNCLLNQTIIEDMEILMIDDGSSDESRYIIEKYALDYDNFHAFHQENKGPSNSRNMAIPLAKGEYIHFLDSDDYLDYDCYESLYQLAKRNDSDIVIFRRVRLKRYNIKESYLAIEGYKNINKTLDSIDLKDYPGLIWDTFCTNKIYKREFIEKNNLKFKQIRYYEDVPFGLESLLQAEKISIANDIFYYWRIRENNNPSITQQYSDINNFKDRIKMINLCNEIIDKEYLYENLKNELNLRWVDYDLNIYLRKIYQYDKAFHMEIIKEIKDILDIVPKEIMKNLNSSKKILYRMIENEDIEGLINFSKEIPELMNNPHIPDSLEEEYIKFIDFENDAQKENLKAKITSISNDEENIYIEFHEKINFLEDNYPHKTKATLINEKGDEYPLELKENLKQIILPIYLINNEEQKKIKIEYCTQDFKKESLLRNLKRDTIQFDGFDVEIGIKKNGIFFIYKRPTSDLTIKFENIDFKDEMFTFYGVSDEKIDNAYIENVIETKIIQYDVISEKNGEHFNISFSIPYEDILSYPVRKWEIKVENKFKEIRAVKRFEFYKKHNKIYITNARNKLLISDDLFNIIETLNDKNQKNIDLSNKINLLKNENKKIIKEKKALKNENKRINDEKRNLKNENKKIKSANKKIIKEKKALKNENEQLKDKIEEYKSRFVVRYADKLKKC